MHSISGLLDLGRDLWEVQGSEVTILRDWDALLHSSEAYTGRFYRHRWPVAVKYISPHRASFSQIYKLRDWNKTQRGKPPKNEWVWPWNIHMHELRESRITVTRHTQTEELRSQHFYLVLLKWKLSFCAAAHKAVVPELIYPTIATPTINFLCCRRCKCNETAAQKLLSPVYTGATNNSQSSQWLIWFITDLWTPDSRKTQKHTHLCNIENIE